MCIIVYMTKHRFQLVLPVELWQRLKNVAKSNRRPISEEARIALEEHLEDAEDATDAAKARLEDSADFDAYVQGRKP